MHICIGETYDKDIFHMPAEAEQVARITTTGKMSLDPAEQADETGLPVLISDTNHRVPHRRAAARLKTLLLMHQEVTLAAVSDSIRAPPS